MPIYCFYNQYSQTHSLCRQFTMDEQEGTNLHTTTTEAITSLLTLRQLRAKIFAQLSLSDQRPLRLVCRDWDKTVLQVRPNMSTVRVMCLFNLEAWGHFFFA